MVVLFLVIFSIVCLFLLFLYMVVRSMDSPEYRRKHINQLMLLPILENILIIISCLVSVTTAQAYTYELDEEQRSNADRIASVAAAEWDTYGVLPSVAVAQAYIESQLGKARYNGYNMWGIGGAGSSYYYGSVEEGTYGYLRTINNGYYGSAPFTTDPWSQIYKILAGGYCPGSEERYVANVMWTIDTYNFDKYDTKMWTDRKKAAEKRKKAKQLKKDRNQKFTVIYDLNVPVNELYISGNIVKKGAVCLYDKDVLCGIFDVKCKKGRKNYIRTSNPSLVNRRVRIKFYEEAVG